MILERKHKIVLQGQLSSITALKSDIESQITLFPYQNLDQTQ